MPFHLSDKQWKIVAPLVTRPPRMETRGRKRRSDRQLLDAVLYRMKTGRRWRRLRGNGEYPPFQTCHRRFQEWYPSGALDHVLEALARDMEKRGKIPLRDCFFDNAFVGFSKKSFVFVESPVYLDCEPPEEPWQVNAKDFFQTSRIWDWLLASKSPWIRERLPRDLQNRRERISM